MNCIFSSTFSSIPPSQSRKLLGTVKYTSLILSDSERTTLSFRELCASFPEVLPFTGIACLATDWESFIVRIQLHPVKDFSSSSSRSPPFCLTLQRHCPRVWESTKLVWGSKPCWQARSEDCKPRPPFPFFTPVSNPSIPGSCVASNCIYCPQKNKTKKTKQHDFYIFCIVKAVGDTAKLENGPDVSVQSLSFLMLRSVWRLFGSGLLHWILVPFMAPMLLSWLSE